MKVPRTRSVRRTTRQRLRSKGRRELVKRQTQLADVEEEERTETLVGRERNEADADVKVSETTEDRIATERLQVVVKGEADGEEGAVVEEAADAVS